MGDQYKPDKGGGTEIINVFFENNIFYKNHWPKDVLIQPKNNIILTENDLKKQFSGSNSYISNLEQNLKEHMIFDINRFDASYIFDVLGFEKIKISKIKETKKVYGKAFKMKISEVIPYVLTEELEKEFSFHNGNTVIVKFVLLKLFVTMD